MNEVRGFNAELLKKIIAAQDNAGKRINVLDYALMNEDGHTYFLQAILQHRRNGKQVFIESFLKRILENDEYRDEEYTISSQVSIIIGDEKEKRRLDLLIRSRSKYIIIENKVKLATDGDRQMEAYWQYANAEAGERARLVYLTLAGGAPAKWSLGEHVIKSLLETGRYCEKNYRTDIVEWLKEDVLPNCLVSESYLSQSIRLYIDAISRLSGMYDKSDLAEDVYKVLENHGVSDFDGVQEMHQKLNEELGRMATNDENWVLLKEAVDLVGVVRTWLVRKCVYDSHWDTAYNLKWLLKNNPTLEYKSFGTFDVAPFSSITQFTYCGDNYVQLATKEYADIGSNLRIHICCSADGIKKGPYVFDAIEKFVPFETMKNNGFKKVETCYRLPMTDFNKKITKLSDVARFVEEMVKKLRDLSKKYGRPIGSSLLE